MNSKTTLFSFFAILIIGFTSCEKKYSNINVSSASKTYTNASNYDFDVITLNSTEADNKVDFVMENTGTKDLTVSSIELIGANASAFTLDKKNFSDGAIGKGKSQTFSVSLKTATAGDFSGAITIKSDAKDANTFTLNLIGTVQ